MHLYFFSRESLLSRFKSFSAPFHEKEQRFKSFLTHLFNEKGVKYSPFLKGEKTHLFISNVFITWRFRSM